MKNDPRTFLQRLPLYVRVSYALIVLFGIVGSFVGRRDSSNIIFIVVGLVWTMTRILQEGVEAWTTLHIGQPPSKDDSDDDDPDLPSSTA
jgi:hypothetical protein